MSQARAPGQRAASDARGSFEPQGSRPVVSSQAHARRAGRALRDGQAVRNQDLRLCQRGIPSAPARSRPASRIVPGISAVVCRDRRPTGDRCATWPTVRSILQRHRVVASRRLGARLPWRAALRFSKSNRGGLGRARAPRARGRSGTNAVPGESATGGAATASWTAATFKLKFLPENRREQHGTQRATRASHNHSAGFCPISCSALDERLERPARTSPTAPLLADAVADGRLVRELARRRADLIQPTRTSECSC
jgi:hypothetical protein